MAITAFSKKYSCELDAIQYFSQIGHDIKQDYELIHITEFERSIVRGDIYCPSCGVTNASIVSGSKGHRNTFLRQPHFRFIDINGHESHDEYCDLRVVKPFKDETSHYTNFTSGKSDTKTTRIIGELISSALSNKIISQANIIEFRQWHFNIKKNNIIDVNVRTDKLFPYRVYRCREGLDLNLALSPTVSSGSFTNKLALDKIVATNKNILEKVQKHPELKIKDKIISKYFEKGSKKIFDVRRIVKEYQLVEILSIAILDSFRISLRGIKDRSVLQAFCGLLLYKNEWNVDNSINMCNEIIKNKANEYSTLGNIIGFNPFYKFELFSTILNINEVQDDLPTRDELNELMQEVVVNITRS